MMKSIMRKRGSWLLLISIIGFIYTTTLKKQKCIFEKKFYGYGLNKGNFKAEKGSKYLFAFSTSDEELSGFAHMPYAEAFLKVFAVDGEIALLDTLKGGAIIDVGVQRIVDVEEYEYIAKKSGMINYYCRLIKGDECELIIYRNIEDWRNMLPALFSGCTKTICFLSA